MTALIRDGAIAILVASVVAIATLAGCTSTSGGNDAAAAAVALTGAEKLATVYVNLPRCPAATNVCSDPAIVAKIKAADNAAYTAVKQAEVNPNLVGAATAAVNALIAVIPQVQ